ncbi:lactadherin-like [Crotalus adamanteus]
MGMQRWAPELARLHNSGFVNAWRASNEDKKPWIQINLLKKMFLSGVVTQGAGRLGASEFVRTYKVSYSLDGRVFEFYKDENENHEKIFSGNTDKYTAVTNMFNSPVIAQYFRIHPVTYEGGYTLRFELIGCEMNGCSDPLGVKSHRISDQQITASSVYKTWGLSSMTWHPYYARLDNTGKSNAWTALRNKPGEWLQIDLLKVKKVSGIITQGARDFGHIQYVAAYKVAYSNDGKSWTVYHDDNSNSIKLFQGNHDNNSHKKNMFDVPFHARFVRILPEAWHNRITLRVELLGCDE